MRQASLWIWISIQSFLELECFQSSLFFYVLSQSTPTCTLYHTWKNKSKALLAVYLYMQLVSLDFLLPMCLESIDTMWYNGNIHIFHLLLSKSEKNNNWMFVWICSRFCSNVTRIRKWLILVTESVIRMTDSVKEGVMKCCETPQKSTF